MTPLERLEAVHTALTQLHDALCDALDTADHDVWEYRVSVLLEQALFILEVYRDQARLYDPPAI